MNNKDLVFSALMGSKSFKTVERLSIVQNDLTVKGLPNIPFLSTKQEVDRIPENQQYFPLSFSFTSTGTKWLFPFEPIINITGGNEITKSNVSKHGVDKKGHAYAGTMKTRSYVKDYEITITGVLIGKQLTGKPEDCFPRTQMKELFEYLIFSGHIYVYSHVLELMGINQIVIVDYSFPFTKGENVQAYEIKALSDFPVSLIVKD
ncbi:DUF6046 domain-containing protein [Flavobacterium chilense]|uniref:DUF6046 domain-containing protein n=1 Tax=Flavobacterium chilense TaxID=946677 RepID=A0A1M7DPZ1_9FLAO|nr:DUF6046 domain-containing protein [Flavobacterium chilense]SHL81477.1 hypothetical protein SAMN05444484_102669 [Flavobacterium chilense]